MNKKEILGYASVILIGIVIATLWILRVEQIDTKKELPNPPATEIR